jgi:hypothetical protein
MIIMNIIIMVVIRIGDKILQFYRSKNSECGFPDYNSMQCDYQFPSLRYKNGDSTFSNMLLNTYNHYLVL